MIRSPMARLLVLALAGSASLAAPTAALAHGNAHGEAAEHARHHAEGKAHERDYPAVRADEHDEDHAHPRLEPSAFTRMVKDLPAIHSNAVVIAIADVVCLAPIAAPEPNESPPDRPGAASAQSRAPPAL